MSTTITTGPGTAEDAELRAAIDQMNSDARDNWFDDGWREEQLEAMGELIWEGFQHENLLELFATVEVAGEFEEITVEEVRGLEVFWTSEGGNIEQSVLTERVWRLPRDFVGFHVSELIRKMRSNFAKYQGDIIGLAIQQIDAAINARLFRTIQAAVPSSSPYYATGTGITLPQINTMIDEVDDEVIEGGITIVGRTRAVNKVMDAVADDGAFAPETQQRILEQGVLGQYRGATIAKLKNFRDLRDVPFFPGEELFVVGTDASKVGLWGGLMQEEWNEQGGAYWHHTGRRDAGFAVHHPERLRRYVDTTL